VGCGRSLPSLSSQTPLTDSQTRHRFTSPNSSVLWSRYSSSYLQPITIVASPLLQLPRELREDICLFALLTSDTPTSLIATCHQLNMEAQPLLYQRPVRLSSQTKLFDWVSRSRNSNLKQVRHLALQLTDVDMTPTLVFDKIQAQRTPSAWSLYEDELSRFDAALRSLPSLTEITIVPPRAMHSQLLRGMYLSLLALIPRSHPGLKLLIIHDEAATLDMVTTLRGLPKVIFKDSQGGRGSGEGKVKKSTSPHSRSPRGKFTRVKIEGEEW
jgi:hypothetical protein